MNGIVERMNRPILNKAKKLMFGAKMDVNWWCEAAFMVNIHRNILL